MKRTIGNLSNYSLEAGQPAPASFTAFGEGGRIHICACAHGIVQIEYFMDGVVTAPDFQEAARFMTAGPDPELTAPRMEMQENEGEYILTILDPEGSPATIHLEKTRGGLTVYHGDILVHGGRLGNQDTVIPAYQMRCISATKDSVPMARFNFPLDTDDAFYGLGDKTGKPNRRGRRFRLSNRDSLGYDAENSDPLYKSVPFFIKRNPKSGACCGLFFPAAWIDDVDFGLESPYYYKIDVKGGPFTYYVLTGKSYQDILEAYCHLVGLPALPPLFSFGFFGSSMNYVEGNDAAEKILRYFARVEEARIPCEGMYVSSGYLKSPEGKRYAFLWNKNKFPDYKAFLRSLSRRGYNLCMNIKPGILCSHPWYEDIERKGFLIKDAEGLPYKEFFWGGEAAFIDFDNPEALDWWKSQLREKYFEHGCTGIWNDNNELELEDPELSAFRTKALYPVKMAKAAYEAFKENEPDVRPWVYSRSGYAGLQRYARTWTGDNCSDWKTLRYNQYMGLSLGLSGMPFYGHDLGGFFGEVPSEELLVRSCQSAVFQPRFAIHSWREDGNPTEPWTYPRALSLIRGHILEHYRFMPYTYNCAIVASLTGVPVERPLFLEFPRDASLEDLDLNSMYGPSILKVLVADESARSATVRFPETASWYDPLEHSLQSGGCTTSVSVPLEGARWFAKTGSAIPTSPGLEKLKTAFFPIVDFLIFPPDEDGESRSTYYEDDGRTEWKLGRYNKWSLSVSYNKAIHRGRIHIVENHNGGADSDPDRIFRFTLPHAFKLIDPSRADTTVGRLRVEGGGEWEFEGSYLITAKEVRK